MVILRRRKRAFVRRVDKTLNLKFQMGITGVSFGPIGMKPVPNKNARSSSCSGEVSQGGLELSVLVTNAKMSHL